MNTFLDNNKIVKVADAATAATTAVSSSAIDMSGFDAVTFFSTIATANAGNLIKIQTDDNSSFTSAADVTGATAIAATDGDIVAVELTQPVERYVRAQIVRGASTVTGEIWAILSKSRTLPVNNNVSGEIVSTIVQP